MMTKTKIDARRRGIRMAAQVAALGGVLAAAASTSFAGSSSDAAGAEPSHVADALRIRQSKGNCGCAPCWGPPAPPAMEGACSPESTS